MHWIATKFYRGHCIPVLYTVTSPLPRGLAICKLKGGEEPQHRYEELMWSPIANDSAEGTFPSALRHICGLVRHTPLNLRRDSSLLHSMIDDISDRSFSHQADDHIATFLVCGRQSYYIRGPLGETNASRNSTSSRCGGTLDHFHFALNLTPPAGMAKP